MILVEPRGNRWIDVAFLWKPFRQHIKPAYFFYVYCFWEYFFVFQFCQVEIENKHEKDVKMTSAPAIYLSSV